MFHIRLYVLNVNSMQYAFAFIQCTYISYYVGILIRINYSFGLHDNNSIERTQYTIIQITQNHSNAHQHFTIHLVYQIFSLRIWECAAKLPTI